MTARRAPVCPKNLVSTSIHVVVMVILQQSDRTCVELCFLSHCPASTHAPHICDALVCVSSNSVSTPRAFPLIQTCLYLSLLDFISCHSMLLVPPQLFASAVICPYSFALAVPHPLVHTCRYLLQIVCTSLPYSTLKHLPPYISLICTCHCSSMIVCTIENRQNLGVCYIYFKV
jgi:hypothetical protein